MGLVLIYEIISRIQKFRAAREGKLTEDQKEEDMMRVQAERMGQLREVQLQRMAQDAKMDAQIEQERVSADDRASKGKRGRRQSVFGRGKRGSVAGRPSRGPPGMGVRSSSADGGEPRDSRRFSSGDALGRRSSAESHGARESTADSEATCETPR